MCLVVTRECCSLNVNRRSLLCNLRNHVDHDRLIVLFVLKRDSLADQHVYIIGIIDLASMWIYISCTRVRTLPMS